MKVSKDDRRLWLGWLAGFCVLVVLAFLASPHDERLLAMQARVPALLNQENALKVAVVRLRYGLDGNYDIVNRHFELIGRYTREMESLRQRDEFEASLGAYEQIVARESDLVETFKYQNAVVRNSLRYLQSDSRRLVDALSHAQLGVEFHHSLSHMANMVVLMILGNDETLQARAQEAVKQVEVLRGKLSGDNLATLDRLLRHVRLLVRTLPEIDLTIRNLLDSGSRDRLEAINADIRRTIEADASRANYYQVLLVLLSIGLSALLAVLARRYLANIRQVASQQRFLQSLTDNVGVGVVVVDADDRVTFANPHAETLLGYELGGLSGVKLHDSVHVEPDGRPVCRDACAALRTIRQGRSFVGESHFRRRDGVVLPVLLHAAAFADKERQAMVLAFQDVSEIQDARRLLERMAYYDTLTGLPNRALLQDRISQSLSQARRNNKGVALLMLDLDNFKGINDSLGHGVGDELLRQVSRRIQDSLRGSDTSARLGGDEFAVLIPEGIGTDDAARLAEKLIANIGRPYRLSGLEVVCGASVGITFFPQDAANGEDMLRNADAAMFRAKESGKNQFQFYTREMGAQAMERLRLESHLRQAMGRNELSLHFQPQCRTDGQVVGAEALLRWRSALFGQVSPARFIPIAERSGLIIEIGDWVLREACRHGQRWREQRSPDFRIAVNLSPAQFRQPGLVAKVGRILEETGLPAEALELEITEGLLVEEIQTSQETLSELKRLGCKLAIDDFGTGYSSLAYLKRFDIDVLKIDKSFIDGLGTDTNDSAMVRAIVNLSRGLGLNMVAEGVEKGQQFDELVKFGGGDILIQGYLMGHPMPVDEFDRRLADAGH